MSEKTAHILEEFLRVHKMNKCEFCKSAGISRFSLYKYLSGTNIHPKTARRIEVNLLKSHRIFLPHEKLID